MLSDVILRLRALFRGRAVDREIDEELRFHVERQIESHRKAGLGEIEATRQARLDFGGVDQIKEEYRDALGVRMLGDLGRDLRIAVRSLRATPIVTAVAILSLALAIGANTAIFSILNGLVLRTLPVREPERLVLVSDVPTRPRAWSYPLWEQIRQRPELFDGSAAWSAFRFNLASGGETQFIDGVYTSGTFFDTLGVRAVLGRTFSEADDQRGGGPDGPVAVIGYSFWQRHFGGAADVIGRSLRVEGVPFTIVGVTPPEFFGTEVGRTFDVVVPIGAEPLIRGAGSFLDQAGSTWLRIIARLKPGQSVDAATVGLRGVQAQIRAATMGELVTLGDKGVIERYLKRPFTVFPAPNGHSELRGSYERPLVAIMVVVTLVLLIACVNIVNLLLARAIAKRHELSVRLALGASRWQLVRQLLAESLVLSSAGAALGLTIAAWSSRLLVRQLSTPGNQVFLDLSIDARILGFTVLVSAVTTLLFGTLPAFRTSSVAPGDALKDHGRGASSHRRRGLAGWLIVAQVALSVVLVVAAGLFIRSLARLTGRQLGFQADQVLVVTIDSPRAIVDRAERIHLYEGVLDRVREVPNVADAAISLVTPFGSAGFTPPVKMEGVESPSPLLEVWGNLVSPGWFRTYGTPVIAGRDFTNRDRSGAPRVAIVNEALARRFFDGRALGRTIALFPNSAMKMPPMEIVGIVADAVGDLHAPEPLNWYVPIDQFDPPRFPDDRTFRLSVRSRTGLPALLTNGVAAAVASVDPRLSLTFLPLSDQVRVSVTRERVTALLAGSFGALALLLAGLGLYGVTAYGVSQRRIEIGIRMALGAPPSGVVRIVLARISRLVGVGVLVGVGASLWASRFVTPLIYGLEPRDPVTLIGAVLVLAVIAGLAAWLPARRAVGIDPAAVLRES